MPRPTPADYAVLEIRIRALAAGSYPVEMTLGGEQELATGSLDAGLVQQVRKARWEPQQGEVLFRQLFGDPRLRSAWDRARGAGRRLRLRLRI
ncbi:MAG: hypothetical protein HC897_20160, partial [Thermoanaerobaculia bacterium]|nr:hypothetical protein [Thermoanaerobaculia bacterium]